MTGPILQPEQQSSRQVRGLPNATQGSWSFLLHRGGPALGRLEWGGAGEGQCPTGGASKTEMAEVWRVGTLRGWLQRHGDQAGRRDPQHLGPRLPQSQEAAGVSFPKCPGPQDLLRAVTRRETTPRPVFTWHLQSAGPLWGEAGQGEGPGRQHKKSNHRAVRGAWRGV